MDKYQRTRTIRKLLLNEPTCATCGLEIGENEPPDNLVLGKIDTTKPHILANLCLRHRVCKVATYGTDEMEKIVEMMSRARADEKICMLCGQTWMGASLEDIGITRRGGVEHIVHSRCTHKKGGEIK